MFRYRLTIDGTTMPIAMSLAVAAGLLERAKRDGRSVTICARIIR